LGLRSAAIVFDGAAKLKFGGGERCGHTAAARSQFLSDRPTEESAAAIISLSSQCGGRRRRRAAEEEEEEAAEEGREPMAVVLLR